MQPLSMIPLVSISASETLPGKLQAAEIASRVNAALPTGRTAHCSTLFVADDRYAAVTESSR